MNSTALPLLPQNFLPMSGSGSGAVLAPSQPLVCAGHHLASQDVPGRLLQHFPCLVLRSVISAGFLTLSLENVELRPGIWVLCAPVGSCAWSSRHPTPPESCSCGQAPGALQAQAVCRPFLPVRKAWHTFFNQASVDAPSVLFSHLTFCWLVGPPHASWWWPALYSQGLRHTKAWAVHCPLLCSRVMSAKEGASSHKP